MRCGLFWEDQYKPSPKEKRRIVNSFMKERDFHSDCLKYWEIFTDDEVQKIAKKLSIRFLQHGLRLPTQMFIIVRLL